MFKLSKKEHLESLLTPLRKNKYRFRIKEKQVLSDSYVSLTFGNKQDFLEIKLIRKWTRIFGKYHISLLCSNIKLLDHLDLANQYGAKHTKPLNLLKKKFHQKLNLAIVALRQENIAIFSSTLRTKQLNESIFALQKNPLYQEELSIFDFVRPAIGIEMTSTGMHPTFGISVGGHEGGGLMLFDPFEGEIELGAYTRVGGTGIYDSVEYDISDTIGNILDSDD